MRIQECDKNADLLHSTKTTMRQRTVKLSGLGLLSFIGIAAPGLPSVYAADAADEEALETVVVTGSRIRQTAAEGPSPVVSLSGEQLEAQGFTTVYEALKSFTQMTGVTQDDQYTGGFTQNANAINMRGLGPGRTLILLDGRRLADYPLPYNGESNFVNIAAIPTAAIDRIEVLSGGASAIYGSDAIAGVVNIILRKNIDLPLELNFRVGNTTQGGGKSIRVQGVGGFNHDLLSVTYAVEYLKRDPIFGFQRNFMDSIDDHPDPAQRIPARAILRDQFFIDSSGGFHFVGYVDPGSACDAFTGFERSFRPGFGYYCGQPGASAQRTVRNERNQGSVYTNATLDLGGIELFGSLNYFHSNSKLDDNATFWYPGVAPDLYYVYNESTDTYEGLQRYFLPGEQGGYNARASKFKEETWNVAGGVRGDLGDSSWKYEATVNYSHYKVDNRVRRFLFDEIEEYFLGPRTSSGFARFGIPAYVDIPFDRLYTPISPSVYNQFTAITRETAVSATATASAVLTGDLLQLPAGALSMASIVEWGSQRYRIHPDPGVVAGDYWSLGSTGGGGERDRYAAGVEFSIPIVASLRASLAGRYDKYDDITQLDDALTYKAGLEYRPIDAVLLRGSASSSFRAPDMHYVFADPSGSFETVQDRYLCRRDEPGVPASSCTTGSVDISSARTGNPRLKEETGKSFTVGFVLEPLTGMKFSADYYHMDLDDLVLDRPLDNILEAEADCRLGQTRLGAPVNVNSAECQDALARIRRNPADGSPVAEHLNFVATGPFNTANYKTSGIDTQFAYSFEPLAIGRFGFQAAYTHVLKFELQNFAGDPVENARDDLQSLGQSDFRRFALRSHVRSSVTWDYQAVTATVFAERLGSVANWGQTGRIAPQTYFNASIEYRLIEDQASIGLSVNNVFDKNPPYDSTNDEYPYYSIANYSPIGREVFVSLGYKFD